VRTLTLTLDHGIPLTPDHQYSITISVYPGTIKLLTSSQRQT